MSGIAGLVQFDGAPIPPGTIERMTNAMRKRGPDGISHWQGGFAAIGHCMFRTTPESIDESQPLVSQDGNLVLVLDGRVDNCDELRRELLSLGAVPRDRTDAELVLKAFEAWGEDCPDRIIGEYVFFVWDARCKRLFGARDAVGIRHFYYHANSRWFAFASEIAGLLALGRIEPRLNEIRLLDYVVDEYDREDEVGTFYVGIERLPAGHAMLAGERGMEKWRYWIPSALPQQRFRSVDECGEALQAQLRVAAKCRLRSLGGVGAELSGGLDSSSVVGVIASSLREELAGPLMTFSLVPEGERSGPDWACIEEMSRIEGISPTFIGPDIVREAWRRHIDSIQDLNEPFALSEAFPNSLVYEAARERDCRVVMDGMAGDLLFYGATRSLGTILQRGMFQSMPAMIQAWHRHGSQYPWARLAMTTLHAFSPKAVRNAYREARIRHRPLTGNLELLRPRVARDFLARRCGEQEPGSAGVLAASDQEAHARIFMSGMLNFAHEVNGQLGLSAGVEPRSPFSDRRVIEFAITMPLQMKLYGPWYKHPLRVSMAGMVPDSVRWRRDLGQHPGWRFYRALILEVSRAAPEVWNAAGSGGVLARWLDPSGLRKVSEAYRRNGDFDAGLKLFKMNLLAHWLDKRHLAS